MEAEKEKKKQSFLRETAFPDRRFLSSSQNYQVVGHGHSFPTLQKVLILPRQNSKAEVDTTG